MAQPVRFQALVEELIRHTPNVVTLHLKATRRLPRFLPGQFIHLTIEDFNPASFWPESRVFSVANSVSDRRSVTLTISRQGDYTSRIIDTLQKGDVVWGKGPYGEFVVDTTKAFSRVVLTAGGTGVTPFGAFMDSAIANGSLSADGAILYYGAQTEALLLYRALADACARRIPSFEVRYFSETAPEMTSSDVQHGRLDIREILEQQPDAEQTAFFLSGPKAMIESFKLFLLSEGLRADQVLIDAWE